MFFVVSVILVLTGTFIFLYSYKRSAALGQFVIHRGLIISVMQVRDLSYLLVYMRLKNWLVMVMKLSGFQFGLYHKGITKINFVMHFVMFSLTP